MCYPGTLWALVFASAMIDESELQSYGEMRRFDDRSLRAISVLGRGAKGVVFLARDEEDGEWLALKVISRALIERKGKSLDGDEAEYRRVCFERDVLRRFQHPLLPRLRGVFETENVVGYAIDYCPGRNLNCLRKKQTEKMFSDDVIRFYAAELVMALEYVHSLGIVYRDLKPENIMIQDTGHIMLVDFDLSTSLSPKTPKPSPRPKVLSTSQSVKKKRFLSFSRFFNSGISPERSETPPPPPPPRHCKLSDESTENKSSSTDKSNSTEKSNSTDKSNSFVGTEEYVAPEIVSGNGHDFSVDWWSMGVVLYEMLYGTTPFRGSNRKETFYRILTKSPELTGEATALRDLIRKLLDKDPSDRIDLLEIKGHDFFSGVDWDSVYQISRPPFIPEDEISSFDDVNRKVDVEVVVQEIFGHQEAGEVGCNNEKQHDRPLVPADPHPNSHNHGDQPETRTFYDF